MMNWPANRKRPRARLRRRDPFRVRIVRLFKRLWIAAVVSAAGAALWVGGGYVHHFLYHSDYFSIGEVIVTGASSALDGDARRLLADHFDRAGDNLIRQDASLLGDAVGGLARARHARVRKIYPRTLAIHFSERRPIMIVNLGQPWLIDRQGVLLGRAGTAEAAMLGLPVLTGVRESLLLGEGSRIEQEWVAEVLAAVDFILEHDKELCAQLVEWSVADGRVNAILRGGAEVRFGARAPLDLLDKLSGGFHSPPHRAQFEQASYIDLRIDAQLVIMPRNL